MWAVYIMAFIFLSAMVDNENSKIHCKHNDIVDIYYEQGQEATAYDMDCPFTKTMRECFECKTLYVSRNGYDKWAKSYTDLRMQVPYPRRVDIDRLYKPHNDKGYRGG